ncbi:unnamed protein product [Linum trigynum]|uniref:DNA helicase Pif1-like 2B domain-containing protein n=1 Tax=Linum trigynum TaxID=586398 RepID=A0AAV2EUK3_9ROSI
MRLAQGASESGEDNAEIALLSRWLLDIGDGLNANIFGESTIAIPPEMLIRSTHDPIADFISATYGDLPLSHTDSKYLVGRAILAPHNETVSNINSKVLAAFLGEEIAYLSYDSTEIDPGNTNVMESDYSVEFLNSLKIVNFPPLELKFKVGCPVILLRNMDQTIGLCIGTRMVVTKLGTWFIEVEILTASNIGERLFMPRLTLSE